MKKTGSLLKEKRESSNLSISEVALATKINPKILSAIESGDEASLPAKTFLKGFLRSYALYLKMDAEEVLRTYQDETGGPPPERVHEAYKTDAQPSTPGRRRVADENSSGQRTAAVVVIVILIGLIIGVRELIEKYQREKIVERAENIKVSPLTQPPVLPQPAAPQSAVADNVTAAATPAAAEPTNTNVAVAAPQVAPATAPTPAATPAPVAAPVPAPVPIPTPAPKVEAKVEAKPEPKSEPKIEPKPTAKVEETSGKPIAKMVKSEIILEALDKVDVKFQIKGETKILSLAPTEVHTIHADQPVIFDFSDGGAVNIILNGRERGVPGDLGKPKQVTIP